MLMWISCAVLVLGIGLFSAIYFTRGSAQPVTNLGDIRSGKATDTNPYQNGMKQLPHVKPSVSALHVARMFLLTAVARKNLKVGYGLVGPALKGVPRAEWIKGNNPVQPVPATNLKTAPLKVQTSTKGDLWLEVGPLVTAKAADSGGLKSLAFTMEVKRMGGKWLVNYFMADYRIPILASMNNGSNGN